MLAGMSGDSTSVYYVRNALNTQTNKNQYQYVLHIQNLLLSVTELITQMFFLSYHTYGCNQTIPRSWPTTCQEEKMVNHNSVYIRRNPDVSRGFSLCMRYLQREKGFEPSILCMGSTPVALPQVMAALVLPSRFGDRPSPSTATLAPVRL